MANEVNPTKPIYVCHGFPVGDSEQEAAQERWLNENAAQGYRLVDRQILGSGGASKRVHVVMELVEPDPAPAAEGGA